MSWIKKQSVYVISGGPGTGKTTTINALKTEGFRVLEEAARKVAEEKFPGKNIKEINPKLFQEEIFKKQRKQLSKIKNEDGIIFSDRGLGDTLAYYRLRVGEIPKEMLKYTRKFRYSGIFILEPLPFYAKDGLRQEDKEEAELVHKEIIKTYEELGYKPIFVPAMSVDERIRFIKKKIMEKV